MVDYPNPGHVDLLLVVVVVMVVVVMVVTVVVVVTTATGNQSWPNLKLTCPALIMEA